MEMESAISVRRRLGGLLAGFGAFIILASVALGFIYDSLTIDLNGIIVIILSQYVAAGSARARFWAKIAMGLYALAALVLLAAGVLTLTGLSVPIKIDDRPIGATALPYVLPILALAAAWSLAALILLLKHRTAFVPSKPQERQEPKMGN